jgi:hypothetical protein
MFVRSEWWVPTTHALGHSTCAVLQFTHKSLVYLPHINEPWERNNMPWLDKHATRQLLLLVSHLLTAGKWTVFQHVYKCSIPTTWNLSTNDKSLKCTTDTCMLPLQGQQLGPSAPPCAQFYSSPSMVGYEPKCIPLLSCRLLYTLQGRRDDLHLGCIFMSY